MTEREARGNNLADIARDLSLDLSESDTSPRQMHVANDANYAPVTGADFYRVCRDNERTEHLTGLAGRLIAGGTDVALANSICITWNSRNEPPLEEKKIRKTVASIARTHAANHPSDDDPDAPLFDLKAASVERFFDKQVPVRDWVLEDCLPHGKTALIVAPGGTGKSQFVLQLAYDIATGRQLHSPWKPSHPGEVLVIGAEDDEDEIHRRFERLTRAHAQDAALAELVALLKHNLFIVSRVSEDNLLTRESNGEVVMTGFVERLAKTVQPLRDLRLIVLDPVSRFRGGDENAAADTTRFVEAVERLAKLTGAALLIVHHVNKGSMMGGEQTQSAARGSSALSDGVRLQINLSYPTTGELNALALPPGKYLVAKITKTNYSAIGEPIYLRKDEGGLLTPVDVNEAQKTREEGQIEQVVEILRAEAAAKRFYSKSKFAETYGGRNQQFGVGQGTLKGIVERAIKSGVIRVTSGKAHTLEVPEPIRKAKVRLPEKDDG